MIDKDEIASATPRNDKIINMLCNDANTPLSLRRSEATEAIFKDCKKFKLSKFKDIKRENFLLQLGV